MVGKKHGRWMLTASFLAVAAFAVWAYLTWFQPQPAARIPTPAQAVVPVVPIETPTEVPPVLVATSCAFEPLVARSGNRDGLFALSSGVVQRSQDPAPFLKVAEEAMREGRARDVEVALISACRIAGHSRAATAPLADVQSRLAEHYSTVATRETDPGARNGLLERAGALLAESVHAYAGALGKNASRTRMAQQQLAAVRQRLAVPAAVGPAPAPRTAVSADEMPQQATRLGASRLSLAERPPGSDEDVGQLDDDLQRLYAQARAVTKDPVGLQRRHQQALAQRSACRGDSKCLRSWHAQHKKQLFEEF